MNLKVLFEDNHLIAVNKPPGMLIHGDNTGDPTVADAVKAYIKKKYKKPGDVFLGVIHRLDRPVSGVTIFARTTKGLQRMNKIFATREVEKTYWAITEQRPPELSGRLECYLWKDREKNKTKVLKGQSRRYPDAKKAVLEYELLGELNSHCLLKVSLETGRSHQIRAQLADMGCQIVGDLKYGFPKPNHDKSIDLHCRSLAFVHPVKKEPVVIKAQPPTQGWARWDWFENTVKRKRRPKK